MKPGTRVTVTAGILKGATGEVIARSARTGTLTVRLDQACGAYQAGATVHLMKYEIAVTAL